MKKFIKLHRTFSYYLLVSPLLLIPVFLAVVAHSMRPVVLFVVFAAAGIIGETLFEAWWNFFFHKPFWTYKIHPLFNGYSSTLNLIPWGFGGMLYLGLLWFFGTSTYVVESGSVSVTEMPFYIVFYLSLIAGIVLQFSVWLFLKRKKKYSTVTPWNYLLFVCPILLSIAVCAMVYGKKMIIVAIVFALVAGWVEYMLGKIFEYCLQNKYWVYNYDAADGGHYTTLSMVPFALAGFYFWSIALIFAAIFP